jgi:FkbM family methyltransferase
MGLAQFANSLRSIAGNPHIHRGRGVIRHCLWQGRKVLNLFPFEQRISRSRIIAAQRRCGVSALIYSQGMYNYNNMKLVQLLLRKGGRFFDVGAHIGAYTLIASEEEKASIFAFEPHPLTFRQLKHNVELNGRTNVILLNAAAGRETTSVFLTDVGGSATNHLLSHRRENAIAVPCLRLDEVCAEHGVTPEYIKIDVEGFEQEVLEGCGDYLHNIAVAFIEMNGLSDARSSGGGHIDTFLSRQGFLGPYTCDFDTRRLLQDRHRTAEDRVYVARWFRRTLSGMGVLCEELP